MGYSRFDSLVYADRVDDRAARGVATFAYDADIKQGKVAAEVSARLDPYGVTIRESRDSEGQIKIPIAIFLDTTGSMASVPAIIQKQLPKLMDAFTGAKKSKKNYLGKDAYPDILVGAVDDCAAQGAKRASGALQVGQFESGIEIDEDITSLWLTANGGGTYEESYEMALYFLARHTAHDHFDKRGKKGYCFIIGDEHPYSTVAKRYVKEIIGDSLPQPITLQEILEEVQEKYNVFFILPEMSRHYYDPALRKYWAELLGADNCLLLKEPNRICDAIVAVVAKAEQNVSDADFEKDFGSSFRKIVLE